jgi:16S rRNA (uracil1498-N3)-methyltransferase
MADRFFTPQPLAPGAVTLDGDEAKHLATVRRFGPGDRVTLFNGDGHEYPATVATVAKREVTLRVESVETPARERAATLTVASALPKGDRFDFLLEKLVELGVTRFVPLVTERSVVVPKADRREKWERAVIEASKQCGRNVLMAVDDPTPVAGYVATPVGEGVRLLLHTGPVVRLLESPPVPTVVAVGPEGGFTDVEVAAAVAAGWLVRSLGPRTLRTETAAIAAAAIL